MKRRTLKALSVFIFLTVVMVVPFVLSAEYQANLISGKKYEIHIDEDEVTALNNQNIKFEIVKVVTAAANASDDEDFDSYKENSRPASWHCNFGTSGELEQIVSFNTSILNTKKKITYLGEEYDQRREENSLFFQHFALTGTYEDYSEAWKQISEAPIGELTFWVMVHLNQTLSKNPNAKFHFTLTSTNNYSSLVDGYFVMNDDKVGLFVSKLNDTTKTREFYSVYNASETNTHGWFKVKIFYDAFNDLYNLTIQQEKSGSLKPKESFIITGDQNDGNKRKNSGTRLFSSNLINKLEFKLETLGAGSPSYAWVDSIQLNTYNFPAVYADVEFENATIKKTEGIAISYGNNSAISTYQAPDFPDDPENPTSTRGYALSFNSDYFTMYTSPNYVLGWEQSPTWHYFIPIVVPTGDNILIQRSLESLFNSTSPYLEQMGKLSELPLALSFKESEDSISAKEFEYKESQEVAELGVVQYIFETDATSEDDKETLIVEYFKNEVDDGVLSKFMIYVGTSENNRIIFFSTYKTTYQVPGYPLFFLLGIAIVSFMIILTHYRRNVKKS